MEWLCSNWLVSIISSLLVTIFWTIILYKVKPNFEIENLELDTLDNDEPCIKVKVINQDCFNAVNVNIEMCLIEAGNTYHFKIDKSDFLIIPHKNNKEKDDNYRTFKAIDLNESTKELYWKNNNFSSFIEDKVKIQNAIIRVRVYAVHSFSGFGRAKGKRFQYENRFFPID